ncbi:hypothetical protein EDI_272050 [Entamoeba dispar SAW760]|uniref:Serine/threonine-protein phosphatase 4 regulatory subunit 3-like central domain-containing protein n=1 Tax=Entamoeba dispar (strain ATCC PRA-260 / SAW760) TaxID=370354 RepID=B0EFK7_ENTDS|nr:uncharacterized protein EDI_272050 [Entamoeba dispar SAW760]EDR26689.1 hypothetical protein EDI_272050 [Entamoeba dispar SAW760]|eukprot:EDR26689.1 hypothetical protein EDI_272050 [Entamoeba dispar SAW760]
MSYLKRSGVKSNGVSVNRLIKGGVNNLKKILNNIDCVSELRCNDSLQDYFCSEEIITQLINYVCGIEVSTEELQSNATKVLCSNLQKIKNYLFEKNDFLIALIETIDSENTNTLSCIIKVIDELLVSNNSTMFQVIVEQELPIDELMKCLDIDEVYLLLTDLLRYKEQEQFVGIEWLSKQCLIDKLLSVFIQQGNYGDDYDEIMIYNVTLLFQTISIIKCVSINLQFNTNELIKPFYKTIFTSTSKGFVQNGLDIIFSMLKGCINDQIIIEPEYVPICLKELFKYSDYITHHLNYINGNITTERVQLIGIIQLMINSRYQSILQDILNRHWIDYCINTFYSYEHLSTIYRQTIFDILNSIFQENGIECLGLALLNNDLIQRMIKEDQKSQEYYKIHHCYFDCHIFNVYLMNNLYLLATKNKSTKCGQLISNDNCFINYFKTVVEKREQDLPIEFFISKEIDLLKTPDDFSEGVDDDDL